MVPRVFMLRAGWNVFDVSRGVVDFPADNLRNYKTPTGNNMVIQGVTPSEAATWMSLGKNQNTNAVLHSTIEMKYTGNPNSNWELSLASSGLCTDYEDDDNNQTYSACNWYSPYDTNQTPTGYRLPIWLNTPATIGNASILSLILSASL